MKNPIQTVSNLLKRLVSAFTSRRLLYGPPKDHYESPENSQSPRELWHRFEQSREKIHYAVDLSQAAIAYAESKDLTDPELLTLKAELAAAKLSLRANFPYDSPEEAESLQLKLSAETESLCSIALRIWQRFDREPHYSWSGLLDPFFETGTEGVLWSIIEENAKGYEGLHVLQNGDEFKVFNSNGETVWEGIIDLEYETARRPYPLNPEYGQQAVFGFWVNGNQRGAAIEEWAAMFFGEHDPSGRFKETLQGRITRPLKPPVSHSVAQA